MNTNINIYSDRTAALRELMKRKGIDAYVVPTDDFHSSEYAAPYFACRRWLTGFTGSAGTAVVTHSEALLWTDGRYYIQAADQLQGSGFKLMKAGKEGVPTITEYLKSTLQDGMTLGYDGRTITISKADGWKDALEDRDITYKENVDLIGEIWEDRPAFPSDPIWLVDAVLTGETASERIARVRGTLSENGADALLITSLDDICWLYNVRGSDQKDSMTCMSYAYITADKAIFYAAEEALSSDVTEYLAKEGIETRPYFQAYEDIEAVPEGITLWLDPDSVSTAFLSLVSEDTDLIFAPSPTVSMKCIKTAAEQEGERRVHIEDGAAVTKLIIALKNAYGTEEWKAGKYTELSVAEMLLKLRKERSGFITESFAPIIASGEHGAIIHYSATEESNVPICDNGFMMMDTGGQYHGGTTDITRTISFGELTQYQKECYTAVLKGHLALGNARFKKGTTGPNLDVLARAPLWEMGLDFNHGTGHGVGFMLNVHEGPQSIHLRTKTEDAKMLPGMITSDEPGVYLEGQFGIRTENLTLCVEDEKTPWGTFLRFEMLTLVPYDRDAIDISMLKKEEIMQIDAYHEKVLKALSPLMTESETAELRKMCAPLEMT